MENIVLSRKNDSEDLDAKRLPIMRTLARFHECDAETLYSRVDASELDVHDILKDMVSKNEVESSPGQPTGSRREEKFTLTLKGWGEYLNVLGSIYELPE
jgi:DNA-binding MarR family transcriptional regulator